MRALFFNPLVARTHTQRRARFGGGDEAVIGDALSAEEAEAARRRSKTRML